jgi:hypothetical protein
MCFFSKKNKKPSKEGFSHQVYFFTGVNLLTGQLFASISGETICKEYGCPLQ